MFIARIESRVLRRRRRRFGLARDNMSLLLSEEITFGLWCYKHVAPPERGAILAVARYKHLTPNGVKTDIKHLHTSRASKTDRRPLSL